MLDTFCNGAQVKYTIRQETFNQLNLKDVVGLGISE